MIQLSERYQCIQGEGSLTGTPMYLLRLQGCDVGCPWCDTKDSWADGGVAVDEAELPDLIKVENPALKWVMVTGGEPCMQDLTRLTEFLRRGGYSVALETSGTHSITGRFDYITVSPKLHMPGGRTLRPEAVWAANEVKMPVGQAQDIHGLIQTVLPLARSSVKVSLQPLSTSPAATKLCYEACLHYGWNLSLQTHKWIGAR